MNVLVYDVAASEGGALSVLQNFYQEVLDAENEEVSWYFVLSTASLKSHKNIVVLHFPQIKKSWFHRVLFDYLVAPKLIKKYKIDKVFSLQNMVIPYKKIPQVVYLHNSIPFIEYHISWKESKVLWIYQNILGNFMKRSLKRAEKTIVQAEWMKEACCQYVCEDKILVRYPQINVKGIKTYIKKEGGKQTFFYPASALFYKNHMVLFKAVKLLYEEGNQFHLIVTLSGDENKLSRELKKYALMYNLPVEFRGYMEREEIFAWYRKSVLVFPSFIETVGLPLLEARDVGTPICSTNCEFSKEALDGYENVEWFKPDDYQRLALGMKRFM